jgi:hypothetical protein
MAVMLLLILDFHHASLFVLIVHLGLCTMLMWTVLLAFGRYVLPPSLALKSVGWVSVHVYIGLVQKSHGGSEAGSLPMTLRIMDKDRLSKWPF